MTDRDRKLIEAARNVFSRYGVAKTTMADIAREAGVARQTLYNAYAGKDEVMRAAVRLSMEETDAAVEEAWRSCVGLEAHLDAFFRIGPLGWYDFAQNSPEAAEILEGVHRVAAEELIEAARKWTARFEALIVDEVPAGHPVVAQAGALADFIYASSINAKYGAESRDILVNRLEMLKRSVAALVVGRLVEKIT